MLSNYYDTRELRNRKKQISMYRVWVQCIFRRPMSGSSVLQLREVETAQDELNDVDEAETEELSAAAAAESAPTVVPAAAASSSSSKH